MFDPIPQALDPVVPLMVGANQVHGHADPAQVALQHIFVTKMRDRRNPPPRFAGSRPPSRDITFSEFTSCYSAARFAADFDVLLDVAVTLDFARLGVQSADRVQDALSRFTRCYSAWCKERLITPAWIGSIEVGADHGHHAHLALHVPGDLGGLDQPFRREFRRWAKGYTDRRGGWVPRAVRVHAGRKESLLTHWINFSYLMKGYDRKELISSGRFEPDRRALRLGDLIARNYRDPGPVASSQRISISNSIGPARRAFGVPTGRDHLLPHGPNWAVFDSERYAPLSLQEELNTKWQVSVPTPYRSPLEDGVLDVRRLYSPCFYKFVTKIDLTDLEARTALGC